MPALYLRFKTSLEASDTLLDNEEVFREINEILSCHECRNRSMNNFMKVELSSRNIIVHSKTLQG